jgi:hypothetical protein
VSDFSVASRLLIARYRFEQDGRMDEQEPPDIDMGALEKLFAEQMRWSTLRMPLHALAEAVPELLEDLAQFEPTSSVALLAGLLTEPTYQSTALRLELLVALALVHARGTKLPGMHDAARWFATIGDSRAASGEDPAEDVFVTLVATSREDFRLLEGLWECAGFYTQCMLDIVEEMPDTGIYRVLRTEVRALLVVADLVCQKAGLARYQSGSEQVARELDRPALPPVHELQQRVTLSSEELASRGVSLQHLRAFMLPLQQRDVLAAQEPGLSDLDRTPLLETEDGIVVALPTAISTVLRDHVIDFVVATRQTDHFNANYASLLGLKIANAQLFGSKSGCKVHWHAAGTDQFASAIFPFDRGHFIVLHFVLPSIEMHAEGRFKHIVTASDTLIQALDQAFSWTTAQIEATEDFRAGLHLAVLCGWGKGIALSIARCDDSRWRNESVSVADLIRLSSLDSMSVARFWRLETAVRGLHEVGVEIANLNGVLNLVGWVELNEGHLVPHADLGEGRISPERPLLITPPLNLLRDIRAKADQATDFHIAVDIRDEVHRMQRVDTDPYFPEPSDSRIYACLDCIKRGELIASCEGRLTVWVRIETPHLTSRDLRYRLWKMLGSWVGSIVNSLEAPGAPAQTFELTFRFDDAQDEVDRVDAAPPEVPGALVRYERTGDESATLHVGAGFMQTFRDPSNVAERTLVEAALRAIRALQGAAEPENIISEALLRIVPNDTGRHFHLMYAHEFNDFIRPRLPSTFLGVDNIDSARLRIGLGWSVYDGDNDVEGADICRALLNRLVDARVEHILAQLARVDRAFLIQRLLINHEVGHATEIHWKRTSAAVLGLHGDSPTTRSTVVEQLSRAAGAQITSRVLIEMALCAAPIEGGQYPAELEIESLLAEVALLIRLGGLSDGIYYGALEPRMRISPLGDILVKDNFGREVVEPMLSTAIGDRYAQSALGQRRHYAAPQPVESAAHLLEPEFVDAWIAEMGFAIDEGRRMLDLIENTAIDQQEPVLALPRSQLVALLSQASDTEKAERFVERFSLSPRAKWDTPPEGFKVREILPWRFGRRLSVVARPLVQVDSDDDPLYMVSPTLVHSGFHYVLRGSHAGTLDQEFFTSPQMRDAWWGQASEGHTFNAKVAERLRAAGWHAQENLQLPAILQRKLEGHDGDVDVLAWRHGTDEVLVIECKDLSFRRNYSEIAALLSDYRGEIKNGKPDKLRRHLNRVDRLQSDLPALGRHTGIESPRITSCLIVGGLVPMQFATFPALQATLVGDIDTLLVKFGGLEAAEPT